MRLSIFAIDAVKQIVEKRGERNYVDKDNIQIVKKEGRSLRETELIRGVVLEKEVVHPAMPKRVEDARIALVNAPMEIEKTEFDAQIRIRSPEAIKAFLDQETEMLRKMVMKVKEAGANVLFCQKGIDDIAQYLLAKEGILAVRRVKESDMEKLARATGAEVITSFEDLRPEDLGWAKVVEERKIGEDKMVFVEGCKDPKSVAVLIRGGLERVVDEAERAMDDARRRRRDPEAKSGSRRRRRRGGAGEEAEELRRQGRRPRAVGHRSLRRRPRSHTQNPSRKRGA